MSKSRWAIVVMVASIFGLSTASFSGNFIAPGLGVGGRPCSEWAAARNANGVKSKQYAEWALGFFSGYNQFGESPRQFFFRYDDDHLVNAVDNFCESNPNKLVIQEAVAFLRALAVKPPKSKL